LKNDVDPWKFGRRFKTGQACLQARIVETFVRTTLGEKHANFSLQPSSSFELRRQPRSPRSLCSAGGFGTNALLYSEEYFCSKAGHLCKMQSEL